jgi:hypothetical protein
MAEQRKLLMTMLGTAVNGLDRRCDRAGHPDAWPVRKGYGVTEANSGAVGQVLFWTLEQGLGVVFVQVSDTVKTAASAAPGSVR